MSKKIKPEQLSDEIMKMLEEYKDTQQLRDALAKQLGNDLVR